MGDSSTNDPQSCCGGLCIDCCRVPMSMEDVLKSSRPGHSHKSTTSLGATSGFGGAKIMHSETHPSGRYPANLILTALSAGLLDTKGASLPESRYYKVLDVT